MSKTRYGHSSVGGGDQDQAERKDEGWTSRQGGDQSADPGRRDDDRSPDADSGDDRRPAAPQGTNTQGELAGIREASNAEAASLEREVEAPPTAEQGVRERDTRGAGTDQPPRMGGPLGSNPERPHLPEGARDNETEGTGAGGFDVGVNAHNVGAVHQGVKPEDAS